MHKTYQAKNFGIVCGEKNDRGGRNIFIFRSEIGSVTGGIRRHGRIYRFADAIFYRLGLCRSFSLGFRRREYPAVQFRGRAGDSGADGARSSALSVRCRFGEYARRYDLLLDRAFGQAGLEPEFNKKFDLLALYSPSDVKAILERFPAEELPAVATFGEGTLRAAVDAGIKVKAMAPTPTVPSMAKAVDIYLTKLAKGEQIEDVAVTHDADKEEFIRTQQHKLAKKSRTRRTTPAEKK